MKNLIFSLLLMSCAGLASAQDLTLGTVTRAPFSFEDAGEDVGFSLDLWAAVADRLDLEYDIRRYGSFSEMLNAVQTGEADAATANISITAEREEVLDFTQPIFSAGLQIMIPAQGGSGGSLWRALLSTDLLLAILLAFGMLFGGGMLMWRFERGAQPYFDQPAKEAAFPAFWWALNLVVNGGFEERVPRTPFGRVFGVILVISSLFIVSLFVAKITSVMTVEAISSSVTSVNDLYGKSVGTVENSTAASFLDRRDLRFTGFQNPTDMLQAFEDGALDAVVFDAPILAYYANTTGSQTAELAGPVFLRENYGIALPTNSPLAEDINKSLLALREDGTYQTIYRKWFGITTD